MHCKATSTQSFINKGTSRIELLSKWTPLLISTVVMFQAQNRWTINSTWKVALFFKITMTTSITRSCLTKQHQNCKTKTDFLVSKFVQVGVTDYGSIFVLLSSFFSCERLFFVAGHILIKKRAHSVPATWTNFSASTAGWMNKQDLWLFVRGMHMCNLDYSEWVSNLECVQNCVMCCFLMYAVYFLAILAHTNKVGGKIFHN